MKILVDTREQLKLKFTHKSIKEVVNVCLPTGDYGCIYDNGTLSPFVFERKGLSDLFGTLTSGYSRFKREMEKAKEAGTTLIIICDRSLDQVSKGIKYSQRPPESLIQQVFTLRARHGIETVFCNDRAESAYYITHFFWSYNKRAMEIEF